MFHVESYTDRNPNFIHFFYWSFHDHNFKGFYYNRSTIHIFIVSDSRRPWFPEPVPNVTVIVGKDALLTCVVQDLHNFKVSVVMIDIYVYISSEHEIWISGYSNSNLNQILLYLYIIYIELIYTNSDFSNCNLSLYRGHISKWICLNYS